MCTPWIGFRFEEKNHMVSTLNNKLNTGLFPPFTKLLHIFLTFFTPTFISIFNSFEYSFVHVKHGWSNNKTKKNNSKKLDCSNHLGDQL